MRFSTVPIRGVVVVEPEPSMDERGLFARTWSLDAFVEQGLDGGVVECSTSFNLHRGTIRGMHYQQEPNAETKLVRCTRGAAFDVVLDLRRDSATYGRWHAVELSAEDRRSLYIPRGVAHGFQTLADNTELYYQISERYVSTAARGVRWDDPAFRIDWPERPTMISERDRNWPLVGIE